MFRDIFWILFPSLFPCCKVMSLSGRHNLQSRPRPQPIRPAGIETRQASWCQLQAWEKQSMQYLSTYPMSGYLTASPASLHLKHHEDIWWNCIELLESFYIHFIDAWKSRAPSFCFPAHFRSKPIFEFHHLSVLFSTRPHVSNATHLTYLRRLLQCHAVHSALCGCVHLLCALCLETSRILTERHGRTSVVSS